ncbi:MAG: hypothetical protein CMD82_00290 [Gammaproteobacteria bacterium]|nr:hypothetical protein [Gammaproteobacteria bacterium]
MFCNNKLIHFVISISIMFAPMMVVANVDAYTTHHHICTFDSSNNDSDIDRHCDNCYFYFSDNHDFINPGKVSNTYLILSDLILLTYHELTGRYESELATRDPPLL